MDQVYPTASQNKLYTVRFVIIGSPIKRICYFYTNTQRNHKMLLLDAKFCLNYIYHNV